MIEAYEPSIVLPHQLDGAASLSSGFRRTEYDSQEATLVNQQEGPYKAFGCNSPTLSDSSGGVPFQPFPKKVVSTSPTLSDSSGGVPCYPVQPSSWKTRQRCITAIRVPPPQTPSGKVVRKEHPPCIGKMLFEEKEDFDLVEIAQIA